MEFHDKGYQIVRNTITKDVLTLLQLQLELLLQLKLYSNNTTELQYSSLKNRLGEYCNPITEGLLLFLQPIVEQYTGKKLLPTYSYVRRYYNGASLREHTDRSSCDYSITLSIQADPNPWPIWIRDLHGENVKTILDPGDIMIYRGKQRPHWRDQYKGLKHTQVFLHFVDAEGPYKDFVFDTREGLAMPFEFKKMNELEAAMKAANK